MLRIMVMLAACWVVFCNIPFVAGGNREYLESIVFAKEGHPIETEKFLDYMRELDRIWASPKSILVTLLKLNRVPDCNVARVYLKHANIILRDCADRVNIVSYTKHRREILVKKCAQDWSRSFIDSFYELSPETISGTLRLKDSINIVKDDSVFLYNKKVLYTKEALVEGLYNYLGERPDDEIARKLNKKKAIKRDEFEWLYDKHVTSICSKLLHDEVGRKFVENSNFFQEQVTIDRNLLQFFVHNFKDYMTRVRICLDITFAGNISNEVYQIVKKRGDGKFERLKHRLSRPK